MGVGHSAAAGLSCDEGVTQQAGPDTHWGGDAELGLGRGVGAHGHQNLQSHPEWGR